MLWIVARASIQSITIDEADTYDMFAGAPSPAIQWFAAANNHILNSMLMRLSTTVFGVSPLSARLPALLGAALYICAAVALTKVIATGPKFRWCLLVCLTCNPYVMDYLVAGRGYSLALAFLLALIAAAFVNWPESIDPPVRSLYWRCAICSLCAALSFAGNFSFAVADAAALALCLVWLGMRAARLYSGKLQKLAAWAMTLVASATPGAVVALLLTGSILLTWPKGALVAGTKSWQQMLSSVIKSSLFQPNPYLLNPIAYHGVTRCAPYLFPVLGIICGFRLCRLLMEDPKMHDAPSRIRVALAWTTGGTIALAICGHYFLFRNYHIPLPFDRTAVFFAPLGALFAGCLAMKRFESRVGRISRRLTVAAVAAVGLYFLCCLRLTYFRDWEYDSHVKEAYSSLEYYSRNYGITSVSSNWRYVAALNFYRASTPNETLPQVPGGPPEIARYPTGKDAYVLFRPQDQGFIERENLKVVYHDIDTGVAVAIRPEVIVSPCRPSSDR